MSNISGLRVVYYAQKSQNIHNVSYSTQAVNNDGTFRMYLTALRRSTTMAHAWRIAVSIAL